jgi:hypothetical protein
MNSSRRLFLRSSAFAMLGGLVAPSWVRAAGASVLTLSSEEQAVADWLAGFSAGVCLVGGAVHERLQGRAPRRVQWRAEVSDFGRMAAGLCRAAGVTNVYSAGDISYFLSGSCEMVIENAVPAICRQPEVARSRGAAAFAHETLVFDPAQCELSDPFGVAGATTLRVIERGRTLPEAFDVVLRGLIESRRLTLTPDGSFKRFQARVLGATVSRAVLARDVSRSLLSRLATWSGVASAEELAKVIGSPLVASSLRVALGVDVAAAVRNALEMGGSAAAWLAFLLAPNLKQHAARGTAGGWLASSDHFDQLRSQAALAEACASHG